MVTIPWCSKMMRNIGAHVALQLYDSTEYFKLEKNVFTWTFKKKINQPVPFCFFLFYLKETWNCKREHILFYAFYSFSTVFTGAYQISSSGSLPGSALTEGEANVPHGPRWLFCHSEKEKKSSASVKLFCFFS